MYKTKPDRMLSWLSVAAASMAAAGLLLLLGWDEYRNWSQQRARSEQALQQASDGLGRHFDDTIQLARMALGDVLSEIRDEYESPKRGPKVRKMMLGQIASSQQLEMVSAIDASGKLIAISANSPPSDVNFSEQDYFRHHRDSRDRTPYIALPARSRLDGNWVLTVSRRVDDTKGNFAGVVVASFTMKYFEDYFRNYNLGSAAAFMIARADGIVLVQAPYDAALIGKTISMEKRFPSQFGSGGNSGNGILYYNSVTDGQQRIGAFKQSPETGVIILTTATVSGIFSEWAKAEFYRWFMLAAVVGLSGFALSGWVVQSRRRMESEQQIMAREAEFRLLAEASVDLIQRLDLDGKRLYVSPAALPLFGIEPAELMGKNFTDGLDKTNARLVVAALKRLKSGSEIEKVVITRRLPNGRTVWVETALRQMTDGAGTSIVAVSRDITAHKLQHSELEELANTDGLTGLSNRRSFDAGLKKATEEARRRKKPLSLLMMDVDCFKKYNDLYGHSAGDECLKAIALALRGALREQSDFAFRYGGEEFAVILTNADLACALGCAERLRASIESLGIAHAAHPPGEIVTVSIGAACLAEGESMTALLERADTALYAAKHAGRNRVVAGAEPTPAQQAKASLG